jgi:DNA-directed RNA polymerase specialized sigma24 family protein
MGNPKEVKSVGDMSRSEINHLIDEWIFSERDRSILKRRLLDGITYEKLADEFDLSVRQTKNIVYKSQIKLFKHVN